MAFFKLPQANELVDRQFFQIPVADGLLEGFSFDRETHTLYAKESQIIVPNLHGFTHIHEDPVPDATCDSHGLMSADDKCKLDSLLQMRLGVLGFQGAGFADDGGFMVGDVILAAGSEFISLERIGNTVRFTVDSPLPLSCACETCTQIFWIQDETEVRAIRPPSCNGVLPDITSYGEIKIYTFPESTLVDPNDPTKTLKQKGNYPALIFKRYENGATPFESEFSLILKRNQNLTTNVGWSMTPGTLGIAQVVWFTGNDKNGMQTKFEMFPETEPGLLGSVLWNGHLITKQMAVIVDYPVDVLSSNQYVLRKWDVQNSKPLGNNFIATNVWRYLNPNNSSTASSNPKRLVLDATVDVLPVGTLVDMWEFELTRNSNQRLTRAFFNRQPELNPGHLWGLSAAVQFGDLFISREEINDPVTGSAVAASEISINDIRQFENTIWGMNSFEDRLILSDDGGEVEASDGTIQREPSGEPIDNEVVADIDSSIPGLRVLRRVKTLEGDINHDGVVDDEDLKLFMCAFGHTIFSPKYNPDADFNKDGKIDIRDLAVLGQQFDLNIEKVSDRPVFLWHRGNHRNTLIKARIGMPTAQAVKFPPIDLLFKAPVDSFDDTFMKVIKRGVIVTGPFAGAPYIVVKGARFKDLPMEGVLRILTGAFRNAIWRYFFKCAFSNWDDDAVMLIGRMEVFPFDEDFPIGAAATECTIDFTGFTGGGASAGTTVSAPEVPINTTVVELLRQDYTSPCIRFQFGVNATSGAEAVQMQVKVGFLNMAVPFELNTFSSPIDDLVRGMAPGYTASKVFIQNGFILDGVGSGVTSNPSGFKVFKGGELPAPVAGQVERWNDLIVMQRDNQVWIWWNGLLVSPDTIVSANLSTPVVVNTPYFPIHSQIEVGKFALRMFPGAVIRSVDVRDQLEHYNEFLLSQLELIS